jgi:hypothetical protein
MMSRLAIVVALVFGSVFTGLSASAQEKPIVIMTSYAG